MTEFFVFRFVVRVCWGVGVCYSVRVKFLFGRESEGRGYSFNDFFWK